jgi:hypothetical protein
MVAGIKTESITPRRKLVNVTMKEVSNNFTKYWMEDGIMHTIFLHDIHLDLDLCIALINFRHTFSEGEKQYWLYDLDKLQTMTKEAKDYAAKYGDNYLHAAAIIVHSHIQKFIINTFIIVKKPKVNTRVFTDKTKAKNWLLELKAKNAVCS